MNVALKEKPPSASPRRYSLADQAKAFAIILREEFGVPFAFFESGPDTSPVVIEPAGPEFCSANGEWQNIAATVAAAGRASVTRLAAGDYLIALLLYEGGKPILVAAGQIPALAPARADCQSVPQAREQTRLQKWVQATADRLRLTDQLLGRRRLEEEQNAQIALAWETILTLDRLIRRLRIHKSPEKNQQRIVEAAFGLLGVQSLIWVPRQFDAETLVLGDNCLAPTDCRQLSEAIAKNPEHRPGEPFLCNAVQETPWRALSPIQNLLAFQVTDQGSIGWFIAINKCVQRGAQSAERKAQGVERESAAERSAQSAPRCTPFRRADAALLTPFAGLMEMHARGSSRYQDLKELLVGLTRSLTSALDAKDSYTFGHSERVARIAVELGRELGLQGDELSDIYLTGLLHDVGKIGVRDAVLGKAGPLTPEEFEHIKQHVTIGYKILADLRPIRNLLPGVLYHHERMDGKGYPDGLAGDNIPLLARILAVADSYDAMSTARPYRDAMPCRKVEQILLEGGGTQWDKRVIEAFVKCRLKIHAIRQQGVGESLCQAIDGALRTGDSSLLWKANPMSKSSPAEMACQE